MVLNTHRMKGGLFCYQSLRNFFTHRLIKPPFSNSLARKVRETQVAESEKYILKNVINTCCKIREIHVLESELFHSSPQSRPSHWPEKSEKYMLQKIYVFQILNFWLITWLCRLSSMASKEGLLKTLCNQNWLSICFKNIDRFKFKAPYSTHWIMY